MSIPDKKLIIKDYDPDELNLAESRVLFGARYSVDAFYQFLLDHASSWTAEEIGAIKRKELEVIRAQVNKALLEIPPGNSSPPLATKPRTKRGRG